MHCNFPKLAAVISAVLPNLSALFTSAPAWIRRVAQTFLSPSTALCSGAWPVALMVFTSAPASIRCCTQSMLSAANIRASFITVFFFFIRIEM